MRHLILITLVAAIKSHAASMALTPFKYEIQAGVGATTNFPSAAPFEKIFTGSYFEVNPPAGRGSVTAAASSSNVSLDGSLTAPGEIYGVAHLQGLIGAITSFQVRVNARGAGSPPLVFVPVLYTAFGSVSCSDWNLAGGLGIYSQEVTVMSQVTVGMISHQVGCGPVYKKLSDGYAESAKADFQVGQPIFVQKIISANFNLDATRFANATATFSGFADPVFMIDPEFQYADQFELEYSPGGGAEASAPESSTYLCVLFGIIPIALVLQRRARPA